ncbi:MAG: aldo/keto reductase [Saprospiraceae bacterium]|nr:aldo/keto reductase [Saprospiraceae bacterium]
MEYKNLGRAGVKVSSLCFGTMTFGDGADEKTSATLYGMCRDKGINFFDCANVYAKGESERILGRLIKSHRDEVVIATKAYFKTSDDINGRGLSRFHLTKSLEQSLKRLDTDYVDLFYLHHFDEETPIEESLSTLNDFVRQGKVLYLGLSNFAAWQVMKSISITQLQNLAPISCIQPMYNLLKRQCESELLPMAASERLGVFPYSPLAGGWLSGKYINAEPAVGRFKTSKMYQKRYEQERNKETTQAFLDFAKESNYHPVSLAIAWVGSNPNITAPIIGARNEQQLGPALDSIDLVLSESDRNTISGFSLSPAIATDRAEER